MKDTGMRLREKLKKGNAARNATDGCGRLSLVSLPGGCASAQVEMGQMERCVLVCGEEKTHSDYLEEEAASSHAQKLCQRHPAYAL